MTALVSSIEDRRVPFSKRVLFILVGAFLILAPASVSSSDIASSLKWIRVGVIAGAFFIGLRWFRWPAFSEISGKVLFLAALFCLAALWSTSPLWGLIYKSMFFFSTCAAIALARSVRTESDFRSLCRIINSFTCLGLVILGVLMFGKGEYDVHNGRLYVAGLNPNTLGFSSVVFLLLALMHLLVGDKAIWKMAAIALIALMSILILYSGSRGSFFAAVSGVLVLLPLLVRKKKHRIGMTVVVAIAIVLLGVVGVLSSDDYAEEFEEVSEVDSSLRMFDELTRDTRLNIWGHVLQRWVESDVVLGHGWHHHDDQWRLVQSAYIQVMIEAGMAGVLMLLAFWVGIVSIIRRSLRMAKRVPGFQSKLFYIFSAILLVLVFHGFFESAMVVGTTPNAILLGFSAAQLDLQYREARASILHDQFNGMSN